MAKKQIPMKYIDWAKAELAKKFSNPWSPAAQELWSRLMEKANENWRKSLTPHITTAMSTNLSSLLTTLHDKEVFFRIENDETGFYLSIIDRQKYPRIWADNMQSGKVAVIAETVDSLINRTVSAEQDWTVRLFGATIDDLMAEFDEWGKGNVIP